MKHSGEYILNNTFEYCDEIGPFKIITVYEPSINLKGILVVDNVARGPSIGGLRMAPDVSTEEYIEAIIDEKWVELEDDIQKVIDWKNRSEQRISQLTQQAEDLKDRFETRVEPREWFLVPFNVIDEAIQKIKDGTIADFVYDPKTASLMHA